MKNIVRNLLEMAMNCDDLNIKMQLEEEVGNLLTKLSSTINCPSDWRSIKEELMEEYADDNDALQIIEY